MNSLNTLLNLGVIKIDFDIELERSEFEMTYLMEQNEVIYSFINLKQWDETNKKNYYVYEIDLFF